jgi:two-component system cell cycle sensor histidine kinase/response regulator CckA
MGVPTESQKTVLLVDDEERDRNTIRQILQGDGYTVLVADSYQHAYGEFESNRDVVDLLIADIALPDGSGCELALAIRNQKPDIRVIFVCGHFGAQACRFYGLDVTDLQCLRKPFASQELARCVLQVLDAAEPFPCLYVKKTLASGVSA